MPLIKVFDDYVNSDEISYLRNVQDVSVSKKGKETRVVIGADIVIKNTNGGLYVRFLGKTKEQLFAEIVKGSKKCK